MRANPKLISFSIRETINVDMLKLIHTFEIQIYDNYSLLIITRIRSFQGIDESNSSKQTDGSSDLPSMGNCEMTAIGFGAKKKGHETHSLV